jgi:hypothetical protein
MPSPAARLHANWGFFAVIYTVMALAMGGLGVALQIFTGIAGVEIGLSIAGYIAAAVLAGQRYVKSHDGRWTPGERHHLALVYALTSFLVSGLVMAAASVAIFMLEGNLDALLALLGNPQFLSFLAVSFTVGTAVYYGLARFALFVVDRQGPRGARQPS